MFHYSRLLTTMCVLLWGGGLRRNGPCEFDRSPTGCTYYIYTHNGITHYYYYYYRHPSCQPVVLFDSVDVSYIMHDVNDIIYSTRIYYISIIIIIIMYTIRGALGWRTSIIYVSYYARNEWILLYYIIQSLLFSASIMYNNMCRR